MNGKENDSAAPAAENGRLHIESLLSKYPSVTAEERIAILTFLTTASALETALLTCNESITDRLEAFRHDNRKQLGITWQNWLFLGLLLGLVAYAVSLMWEVGY
ncbi:hypothetical protein [Parasphingorhabdus sp.]|uniref:hypothetical protein n=1 Tax=Parasphingorhabdus sp. TaxID=2709688 RepID=UPI0030023519